MVMEEDNEVEWRDSAKLVKSVEIVNLWKL